MSNGNALAIGEPVKGEQMKAPSRDLLHWRQRSLSSLKRHTKEMGKLKINVPQDRIIFYAFGSLLLFCGRFRHQERNLLPIGRPG